jgi:hypothetical protein
MVEKPDISTTSLDLSLTIAISDRFNREIHAHCNAAWSIDNRIEDIIAFNRFV